MHNVEYQMEGTSTLVIKVDVSAKAIAAAPPSKTGKTALVGTTAGIVKIPSPTGVDLSFSINVMAKKG